MKISVSIFLTALSAAALAEPGAVKPVRVDFRREVLPIISSKCFHCHGPDASARKAKLRLDVREDALRERDGEWAIVAGDPAKSELIARIHSKDEEEVMPPLKEDKPLTPAEAEVLRKWIEQGADYDVHWSFVKPQSPALPALPPGMQARNAIDHFIAAKLVADGLPQSPEADRYTLLRRAALDLTGLPPSVQEMAAFEKDTSAEAYEHAVDRLLALPSFGEKWARMWLDLARYADSTGYGSDKFRMNIWPYRDWVISAFNRNEPYDRFSTEQLAGDLLPGPTTEQMTATAFHRNTMTQVEGGTDDEEYRVVAVKDRVGTTMQVWMGLTANCAQCHSHKFDPISQKEYYQLFAIFNQTEDADREDEAPRFPLKTQREEEGKARVNGELAALLVKEKEAAPDYERELHEWEAGIAAKPPEKPLPEGVRATLALEPSERTPAQREELGAYFRPLSKALGDITKQLAAKRVELAKIKPLELPIMRELATDKRRVSHILNKGNFLSPGEEVSPAMPTSFGPVPEQKADRLVLSRWIFNPENPLTARVAVNRFWSQIFGAGLTEIEEDFGTQGQFPSHLELLDWLAVAFQSPRPSGLAWDVKALLRLLVTSHTYRQTSQVSEAAQQKDVRNRSLSHYSRRRLDAEAIRDQALALSGLLSPKMGGPSVYPPQPDGLWSVAFNGGQNGYPTSAGEDRHRRGLYTFWRRTAPNPTMTTFDAPSRETCTIRRVPTNTPLQAFVTLNDPVFVECAQALAQRILKEGSGSVEERLRWALQLCLGKPGTEKQVAALRALFDSEMQNYQAHPNEAKQLAGSLPAGLEAAEAAAWTVVANVLLNLDAVLTRG